MIESIVIDGRFNGPPNSGNGGYASGTLCAKAKATWIELALSST